MNSGNNKTGSINAFDFDLGLNSGRSKSLNDKKNQTSSDTYSSPQQKPNTTSSWAHQPTKPAWTHQPAVQSGLTGSLSGPTSMVGDIHGKSWNSTAPSNSGGIGVVNNKNPNLFSDLLGSAMGQNKSSSNVPLKKSAPVSSQSTFSMGGVADSLPKTGYSGQSTGNLGSNVGTSGGNVSFGGNFGQSSNLGGGFGNSGGNGNKNPNLGGVGMGASKDPFVSLVDFGSKPNSGINSSSKESVSSGFGNDPFGDFGSKPNSGINSASKESVNSGVANDPFGDFQEATSKASPLFPLDAFPTKKPDPMDDFVFSNSQTQSQNQPSGVNAFDVLFPSSSDSGVKQFSETDDWGSEFVGGDDNGGTTELDGLPPPPAGVSASSAKNKGMDNYKQGQFADAIKWLSWAIVLLEKARDDGGTMEVLTCRASCYKEVGEYKKAVADCTKVLEHDGTNVSVLVQRALLYESMEKYKLGAEDLRTVMKIDPGNRVARSTVHRLTKMAQ